MGILFIYLMIINIIGVTVVLLDYYHVIPRVPSLVLHLLELMGGVIMMLPVLFILKHNRVFRESYYLVSFWTLTIWFFISYIKFEFLG
ncbi:hypothetical protein HGP29_18835 [Flammeovirga sp. SR4]|uniref:Uncharacterized protein n=2 Tax=Flammeovirga agarivorans TaxID=2726742 RepID=A0A7X8SN59_9BACT|nr:hypothetical protein [Flammeovirga agarivorans]